MPHFLKIVNYIEDIQLSRFLFDTQLIQLEKIKSDAASFIGKKEPPLRWEQTEAEKRSWFRAIEKIVGRNGA
jgi:hypothetical protein